MSQLIIHPATMLQLRAFEKNMPQSIILSGTSGIGLLALAKHMGGSQALLIRPLNAKGEEDTAGTISIEVIRRLYDQSRTKTLSKRFIIIDDADRMSHGAQGAFLKLLEEPPAMTHFILTSHAVGNLLPTIRSRVQHVVIQPITDEQTSEFIDGIGINNETKKNQLQFLASGLPAELSRLARNTEYFASRARIITDARQLIAGTGYQKLRIIHTYKQNRDDTLTLIDSAIAIIRHSLKNKPQIGAIKQLDSLLDARERITRNQSTVLQLTKAVL
ncbi:MAG TPA: hypothetical protein VFH06_04005 [Candidatus Saccharimonadales bacterium]|nr:hypothetical protein [Candidatus Saccharimonadales bacterium]